MSAPPVVVLMSDPAGIPVIASAEVVAAVPVAFTKVKVWRVVEPRTRRLFENSAAPVVVAPPEIVRPPA